MSDEKRPGGKRARPAEKRPPQQRPARKDTIDHAIALLWSAIDELERGHPMLKATLAQGIIRHAIVTLDTLNVQRVINRMNNLGKKN